MKEPSVQDTQELAGEAHTSDRYMRAYYHTFTPTGFDAVDAILEAVAMAGKAYHSTELWDDAEHLGPAGYWGLIQTRANEAAASSLRGTLPLHIVFDGPPGPESGRFVEVETPDGKSIRAGEWHHRSDGLWELRIAAPPPATSSAMEALRVKPLDWIECADGTWHDRDCLFEIEQSSGFWRVARAVTGGGGYICDCSDLEMAKARAQGFHEARILAALQAGTEVAVKDEPNPIPAQDSSGTALGESHGGKSKAALPASVDANVNDGNRGVEHGNEVVTAGETAPSAPELVEPVAWQWRKKPWAGTANGTSKWSDWQDGKLADALKFEPADYEERALVPAASLSQLQQRIAEVERERDEARKQEQHWLGVSRLACDDTLAERAAREAAEAALAASDAKLAEAVTAAEDQIAYIEVLANDLRNDDATRRGAAYAIRLFRSFTSSIQESALLRSSTEEER